MASRRSVEQAEMARLVGDIEEYAGEGDDMVDECSSSHEPDEAGAGAVDPENYWRHLLLSSMGSVFHPCTDQGFGDDMTCSDANEHTASSEVGRRSWPDPGLDADRAAMWLPYVEPFSHVLARRMRPNIDEGMLVEEDTPAADLVATARRILNELFNNVGVRGENIIHRSINQGLERCATAILRDLDGPDGIDQKDVNGNTCLHLAVRSGMCALARQLLAHGAMPDSRDAEGNTPLHLACARGDNDCAQALTVHLDHLEVKNIPYQLRFHIIPQYIGLRNWEGRTCVHLAAVAGQQDVLICLVCASYNDAVEMNLGDGKTGKTALHEAAESGRPDMVKFLIEKCKADVHARSYSRRSPLELAILGGHDECVLVLMASKAQYPHPWDLNESFWAPDDSNGGGCSSARNSDVGE